MSETESGRLWEVVSQGIGFIIDWAPLWVPLLLLYIAWQTWIHYIRAKHIAAKEYVLLEIRVPQEVMRSPLAMELFLNALHQKGQVGDFVKRLWHGNVTPWTSLELISIEGAIHFIIRIEKFFQPYVESQLYAQFPNAEIREVEDYTYMLLYDNDTTYKMWGGEFILTKPDPYPIKTYVDYGLDKDPKEELKVDPITPMLEYLGALGKGNYTWVQIVVRYHIDKNRRKKGKWFKKEDAWVEEAKEEIEKIKKTVTNSEGKVDMNALTPGQKKTIEALERSVTKVSFDVGIRGIYIAEKDAFNPVNIGGLISSFKQYGSNDLNGFKPNNTTGYDYPWQDPWGWRERRNKRNMFDAYRRRLFFHPPYKRKTFVLNTEELATMYHFPGKIATTPTLDRVEAKRAEPPTNLPL